MNNFISKSVLALLATGLVLIAVVVWLGLHPRENIVVPPTKTVVAEPPVKKAVVMPAPAVTSSPAKIAATIDGLPPVIPISLTNFIGDDGAYASSGMRSLPRGTQLYGGIEFWLQGIVRLQGQGTSDSENSHFPTSIDVPLDETNSADGKISVNERGKNIACIYLVGGALYSANEKFADVVWHYADGTTARNELTGNVQLRDWVRNPYEQPAQLPNALTKVAWHGPHPKRKDISVRLYRLALINQHPEKTIHSLEFVSAMARPSLFIAALTLDPLLPGARPDNLTSAEMADPELGGQLQLFVQDTGGQPLANAQVSASFKSASASTSGLKFTTDNGGLALVRFPDDGLKTLNVSAEHDDFSGRKMLWDLQAGDTVPASYTLKLAGEVKIGGMVMDSSDNPIAGATVSLYRFWSGNDFDPNKKGEQASFSSQTQTTDDQGRWQAKGLPPELLNHIGFDVKHPDFVGTNIMIGANAATEKQLRDGTLKIILQRGQDVQGLVTDDNNNPVSGATVWAGRKFTRDRKQTTSGDDGQFSFHSVENGDVLFSVMAKDHSPDSKTINVHAGMDKIVFQLKAGSVIRAHVQDESGQPVAGAWVGLSGNPGMSSYDAYEFTSTTDKNGDFSWNSAPDETMTFNISKSGFESKSDVKLAPNQDNTVTMHKSRTLQGQVLDATSGQPVTKFTVRTGTASPDNSDVYGVIRYKDFTAADGTFSLSLEEEADNAVAVYADGYEDTIQKFPDAQNGVVQVVVQMKPSGSLSGVVLAPDGTPAPGVNVAIGSETPRTSIQLSGGRLHSYDSHTKMATTDADGRFKIASLPDDGTVVAAGEQGFAQAPLADVRSSGTIMLQAWGRIEGTLKIGGQPGAGKDLLLNLSIPGISTDFNGYKTTTDDQGQFTFEKVPPGNDAIVRLISTSPNSWTWSGSTAVTVKSGDTTQVTLGDNGAELIGRIRFDNPPTNAGALHFEGNVSGQMPQQPSFNSQAEAQAYYKSPEWKALMKLHKNYSVEMKPDGSFEVDDVAPGVYSLNISASLSGQRPWEHPPLGQGSTMITVPDSFSPDSPIDVGEVELNPTQPPSSTPQTTSH